MMSRHGRQRGQTSLPAVAVAILLLTIVTGLGLAVADGALASEQRPAGDRRLAASLADRLVARPSPLTERPNVLNATRVASFDARALADLIPPGADPRGVRVRLDGSTLATTGAVNAGPTRRRIVLVERARSDTVTPALTGPAGVTLPRRTSRASITLTPPPNTTVRTVRANDRVVLHDPDGLAGRYAVEVSRFETTRLTFVAVGPLPRGSVEIRYRSVRTAKTLMAVTVDG